jgi:hypothetical protein
VIEDVLVGAQARRPAHDLDPLEETGKRRPSLGDRVRVGDVVGDEQVEAAVAVVVEEGTAGAPARPCARDPGARGDVGEPAAPVVVEELVEPVVGDVDVGAAVVVEVADAGTLPPARAVDAGPAADLGEPAAAEVVIEEVRACGAPVEAGAVDEEEVRATVGVVVEGGRAGPRALEQRPLIGGAAVEDRLPQARLRGNVGIVEPPRFDRAECGGNGEKEK